MGSFTNVLLTKEWKESLAFVSLILVFCKVDILDTPVRNVESHLYSVSIGLTQYPHQSLHNKGGYLSIRHISYVHYLKNLFC